jgi:hypothetical protein
VRLIARIKARRFGPVLRSCGLIGYFSIVLVTVAASDLRHSLSAFPHFISYAPVLNSIYLMKVTNHHCLVIWNGLTIMFLLAGLGKSGYSPPSVTVVWTYEDNLRHPRDA